MVPKGKAARAPAARSVARSLHEDVTNFALGQERKRESEGGRTDEVSEVLFLPAKLVDRSDMLKGCSHPIVQRRQIRMVRGCEKFLPAVA